MWKITVSEAEVLGVHAALLPTGHIIYFTGNQYDIEEQATNQFQHTRLYDCAADRVLYMCSPSAEDDVFCCGHAMLPSGRLLIAGGSEALIRGEHGIPATEPGIHHGIHVPGIRKAFIFDPFAKGGFPLQTWQMVLLTPVELLQIRSKAKQVAVGIQHLSRCPAEK